MSIRHVHAGQVLLGEAGDELRAVLGSCVALTLWHPVRRIGAMCHVLLPRRGTVRREPADSDARFAEDALRLMVGRLREVGVEPGACVCKLFGGASVFASEAMNTGRDNVRAIKALLGRAGVELVSEHVEGTGHRVIRFVVETGDVWVSHRRRPVLLHRRQDAGA
ncbi:chemotaxis protein CheD [Niveibacterium terrae]|uniref:chemotaxis protein CheD n=1 Tax=Niveibacterium terrae TaxID=3373598 RepID=UPI003A93F785